ncbi:MAG: hypothetical protein K5931_10935 [Lachnospiraceae bacterium]|nr:hypothetical protein [Lachnospiraceae bacterium]
MAKGDEIIEEEDKGKKKKDRKSRKKDKAEGDPKKGEAGLYTDGEEEEGGGLSAALIIILIIIIWLAIICLLIKLDVGGFGSNFLYPVLKNVPVINKILPDSDLSLNMENQPKGEFSTIEQAEAEVARLRKEIDRLNSAAPTESTATSENEEQIAAMRAEIERLKTFEDSQVEFQRIKTEFYEEVVFSDEAPPIENYKKYYEEIDPENAEYLYKQVVTKMEADKELDDFVRVYSEMKPKNVAAIFEKMTGNLDLVVKILKKMDPATRAQIMNVLDPTLASQLTKLMDPK